MFRIDWIEKYLSRVRPSHVVAVWGPFILWCLWLSSRVASAFATAGMVFVGVLAWTLLEYGLHRFVFHFEPSPDSEFQKDLSFLIHGIHHDYPWDADRLVMPPVVAALIAVVCWFPSKAAWGSLHYGFFAGLVAGYMAYDLTHYFLHHGVPKSRLGKWLRRYHLVHHFATPEVRYGITTPLWDWVFRTYPKDENGKRAVDETRSEDLAGVTATGGHQGA